MKVSKKLLPTEGQREPVFGKIYFLASPTHVKIGFSSRLRNRTKTIRSYHYEPLELLCVLEGATLQIETRLHKQFAASRVKGKREWFVRSPEIDAFVEKAIGGFWRAGVQ